MKPIELDATVVAELSGAIIEFVVNEIRRHTPPGMEHPMGSAWQYAHAREATIDALYVFDMVAEEEKIAWAVRETP